MENILRERLEGKCFGKLGYVIMVIKINNIDDTMGKLCDETGEAHFHVSYKCLTYRPFQNEIINAEVESVHIHGISCKAGPLDNIFVSKLRMGDYDYDEDHNKFARKRAEDEDEMEAMAGDLSVGTQLRLKIQGINPTTDKLIVTGAIDSDYLGVIE